MSKPTAPGSATAAWNRLSTEARHPGSTDLDTLSTADAVALLLEEDRRGLEAAQAQHRAITLLADRIADTLSAGGDVVFAGAGTSGRLGVLEAAECPPTFGTDPERIRALIAGGPASVFRAREGAEDDARAGAEAVTALVAGDLLVGLSASSVTPYVRCALAAARQAGVATTLLTCAVSAGLEGAADQVIGLATGPEVLTGSTRLKAGSATKAALNAATTAAMVRLGKVFGNLMVDLRPGSAKLVDRARRIVAEAGQVAPDEAENLLDAAGGEVKVAIVMARLGLDPEPARKCLADADGHVRRALSP